MSGTWNGSTTRNWTDTSRWSSAPLYPDGGGIATIAPATNNPSGALPGVRLNVDVSLSRVDFPTRNCGSITSSSGNYLTLVGPAVINVDWTVPDLSVLTGGAQMTNIAGSNGLTKTGAGALFLGPNNIYIGDTNVMQGSLYGENDTAFGVGGAINLYNDALLTTPASATVINHNIRLMSGSPTIYQATIAGIISGSTSVKLSSTTLLSANTYTGSTNAGGCALGRRRRITS